MYYATHSGPAVGPSLSHPFGKTSLTPPPTSTIPVTATTLPVTKTSVGRVTTTTVDPVTSTTLRHSRVTPTTIPVYAGPGSSGFAKRSRPIHLTIPKLGISVPLSELGLNKDHSVQVPTNFAIPGWYKYGPSPGQESSAVILGHVDSYLGPAVFFHLADLRLGNHVIVKAADGKTFTFRVIGLREYSKSTFPDRLVYGPRKYAALQLVTCGGVFDRQTGHYLSNIVVFTALVKK
ncbi:MAG TPA: sortase [Acidimicrobiales bacterium]|nr:sortase [Acidimicrobiales bacterium]